MVNLTYWQHLWNWVHNYVKHLHHLSLKVQFEIPIHSQVIEDFYDHNRVLGYITLTIAHRHVPQQVPPQMEVHSDTTLQLLGLRFLLFPSSQS